MNLRRFWIGPSLALVFSTPAFAQDDFAWLFEEEYEFLAVHDPGTLELNRAYQAVMKSDLSEETKLAIRKAQREWIEFRDASLAAIRATNAEEGGSIRVLEAGSSAIALTRDQTLRLRGHSP